MMRRTGWGFARVAAPGLFIVALASVTAAWAAPAEAPAGPLAEAILSCDTIAPVACKAFDRALETKAAGVTPVLLAVLEGTNALRATRAAIALGLLGDKSAVEPLLGALDKPLDANVRTEVLGALARLADARATGVLKGALKSTEMRARMHAVTGLGLLRSQDAVPELALALNDGEGRVQAGAALALGRIRDPRATGPLLNLVGRAGTYGPARAAALGALGALKAEGVAPFASILTEAAEVDVAASSIGALTSVSASWAAAAVRSAFVRKGLRGEAARAVLGLGLPGFDEELLSAAEARDLGPEERGPLLHAIGRLKPLRCAPRLTKLLPAVAEDAQVDLLRTIGLLGDTSVAPSLLPLLETKSKPVRDHTIFALERLTGQNLGDDAAAWKKAVTGP